MSSDFPYKKILLFGATSGIGRALATRFIDNGIFVIAVGRRQSHLDAFVKEHGQDKCSSAVFDITNIDGIKSFAHDICFKHNDIDGVLICSGMQRGVDFSKPQDIDLSEVELELKTNYTSWLHLSVAFLPHLQNLSLKQPTSLTFISSGLALVPMTHVPTYCATKAALHHLVLVMRQQNRGPYPNMRVIEIFPPAVQTELHDWMPGSDADESKIKQARSFGMPLQEFTDRCWKGLSEGKDQVPVGEMIEGEWDKFEAQRQEVFGQMAERMQKQRSQAQ